jgi:hypothetical protein
MVKYEEISSKAGGKIAVDAGLFAAKEVRHGGGVALLRVPEVRSECVCPMDRPAQRERGTVPGQRHMQGLGLLS